MIRIANMVFDTDAEISGESVETTIPTSAGLTEEQIEAIKNAKLLERLNVNYGDVTGILAAYNLIEWRKVEKVRDGTRFAWQTYRTTDIEQLKQDNEDLTAAVLELAALIGGGNNG